MTDQVNEAVACVERKIRWRQQEIARLRGEAIQVSETVNLVRQHETALADLHDVRAALQAAALPAVPSVPEGWVKAAPTRPGVYAVRGWHFGFPDDTAVCVVAELDGELCCNLHERNSELDVEDWDAIAGWSAKFEWRYLAATPKDQPAALNMEQVRNEAFNLADTVIEHIESGNVQAARDAIRDSLVALAASAPPAGPETWQDRLRIEHAELDARLTKLCAFLESDQFAGLHEDDRRILMAQSNGMRVYLNALTFRVDQLDYALPAKDQPAQGEG